MQDGGLKATLDSPDEGLSDLPIDTIETRAWVTFASQLLAASFEEPGTRAGPALAASGVARRQGPPVVHEE